MGRRRVSVSLDAMPNLVVQVFNDGSQAFTNSLEIENQGRSINQGSPCALLVILVLE
jgi:hypothetical protein